MKIVMIASEAVPFAKTGGLADVLGALPRALSRAGHEVSVIIPFYKSINAKKHKISYTKKDVSVRLDGIASKGSLYKADVEDNVVFYLIKNDEYFNRDHLYQDNKGDYPDNAERFSFFSQAALELISTLNLKPDIVHAHDWQAALALYYKSSLGSAKKILTIHNIGYQGLFDKSKLKKIGLGSNDFTMDKLEFYGKINLLKGGIISADHITTVSPSHVSEILTKEFGFGLEGVLKTKKDHLSGIQNGIDYDIWNPSKDNFLVSNFSASNISGKAICKTDLQKRMKLHTGNDIPLIGMIGRLTIQKGLELVHKALPYILSRKVQLVILGTGEQKYHKLLETAAKDFPNSMRVVLAFDEKLAHQIEGGADFFLMPSLYEPCGLNQLISMKYGTIPIVRATGGLNDTVHHFDARTWKGNGFKFTEPKATNLINCITEALQIWSQPVLRNKLIKNAMSEDFSWDKAAKKYVFVYESTLEAR